MMRRYPAIDLVISNVLSRFDRCGFRLGSGKDDVRRMKGPTRKEETAVPKLYEAKIGKTKRIIPTALTAKAPTLPITYDEAKASCKARKRKERQESISSLCQERKVIRSNSEERPAHKMYIENKSSIRRVSSSEDFQCQRSGSSERISLSPHRGPGNDKTLVYEDCEHEKQRSHERFSRPLTLKSKKHPNKRLRIRYMSRTKFKPEISSTETTQHHKRINVTQDNRLNEHEIKDNNNAGNYLKLHNEERERSPSPTQPAISPVLDLTTLHEQVDSSEPVLSQSRHINEDTETLPSLSVATNRLLSSPRNSIIATHRIYLDPDIPKMISSIDQNFQNPIDEKYQKLCKQISGLKKKIKRYETDFEAKNGYRPSHIEKTNDKNTKKLYTELAKLKREQKQLKEMSISCSLIQEDLKIDSVPISLHVTVEEIEKKLATKREAAGRSYNTDDMTSEQLVDEKVAVQKALLYLESIHGRPNSKVDRDLVRPFYDRYRNLKRILSKTSVPSSAGNELATIHENETMNFVTPNSSSQSNDTESEKTAALPSISTDSDTDTSIGENLHSLPRSELIQQLKVVTEEKKELRRKIKEFELEVQLKTGKMIQKEDKSTIENIYVAYKKTKAKYRLIEALVGKSK